MAVVPRPRVDTGISLQAAKAVTATATRATFTEIERHNGVLVFAVAFLHMPLAAGGMNCALHVHAGVQQHDRAYLHRQMRSAATDLLIGRPGHTPGGLPLWGWSEPLRTWMSYWGYTGGHFVHLAAQSHLND